MLYDKGVVRRKPVKDAKRRIFAALHEFRVKVPRRNPVSRLYSVCRDIVVNSYAHVLFRPYSEQRDLQKCACCLKEMAVRVDKRGQHGFAVKVDDCVGSLFYQLLTLADCCDFAVFRQNGVGVQRDIHCQYFTAVKQRFHITAPFKSVFILFILCRLY